MALLIRGKTCCSSCGQVIETDQAVVAFPSFLPSEHFLSHYNDSVFHEECFLKQPDCNEISAIYARYLEIWKNRPQPPATLADVKRWGESAFADLFTSTELDQAAPDDPSS